MDNSEQDRSEQATPFKLMRARRKGSVARGLDLGFMVSLAAALGFFWVGGADMGHGIAEISHSALVTGPQLADSNDSTLAFASGLLGALLKPILTFAGIVFLASLLFEVLQTGVVFSSEPLKLDFSRLNPAQGLKRLFTIRLLIETFKNVLKLGVYGLVGWLVVDGALHQEAGASKDAVQLLAAMGHSAFRLLAIFALLALIFATLDQLIVRRDFQKKMRMSRRELKREHREREGEPRLKQKRKQLHGEFVKQSQGLRNIKGADMLIVNPTHVAVALRYDAKKMLAPMAVALGIDRVAQRYKRLALLYGVPLIEDPPLARALLRACRLNDPIPEVCFAGVARHYNRLGAARAAANDLSLEPSSPDGVEPSSEQDRC